MGPQQKKKKALGDLEVVCSALKKRDENKTKQKNLSSLEKNKWLYEISPSLATQNNELGQRRNTSGEILEMVKEGTHQRAR